MTQESESGGKILRITPLKPLEFSRGPAVTGGKVLNIGYTVLLTNSLKATDGQAYGPDTLYAAIKSAPADCSSFTDATQKKVCLITKANLGVAAAASSTSADSVILSWTFSTQSIDDSLNVIALTATPKQTLIVPAYNALLGRILTTKDANAALPGKANIYLGSTQLPYYLTAADDHVGRRRQCRCAQQLLAGIRTAPGSVHQHRTALLADDVQPRAGGDQYGDRAAARDSAECHLGLRRRHARRRLAGRHRAARHHR